MAGSALLLQEGQSHDTAREQCPAKRFRNVQSDNIPLSHPSWSAGGSAGGAGVGRGDADPQLPLTAAPEPFPACLPPCCPQPDFSHVLLPPTPLISLGNHFLMSCH